MKITKEQYIKWNNQAKGGFQFDYRYYCIWGEKTLVKDIQLDCGAIIEFRLWYVEEYETITNEWGVKWKKKTGRYIPTMAINLLRPLSTEGAYNSVPIISGITMGEPEKTKKYSTLCKISGEYDAETFAAEWEAENADRIDNIPKTYRVI